MRVLFLKLSRTHFYLSRMKETKFNHDKLVF